jgi:hypothetical protein
MKKLTVICPEMYIYDANQFSRCVGLGPDDDKTFAAVMWQDSLANRYAIASGIVSDNFISTATSMLAEPAWSCDLAAALRAQALVQIYNIDSLNIQATPDNILAVFGDDVHAIISALGLQHIRSDDE